jgi:hypothetical protein
MTSGYLINYFRLPDDKDGDKLTSRKDYVIFDDGLEEHLERITNEIRTWVKAAPPTREPGLDLRSFHICLNGP